MAAKIVGREAQTALLSDATRGGARCSARPRCRIATMLDWVADWVAHERREPRQADQVRGPRWHFLSRAPAVPRVELRLER